MGAPPWNPEAGSERLLSDPDIIEGEFTVEADNKEEAETKKIEHSTDLNKEDK